MKIGNWNVERLKHIKHLREIQNEIDSRNFDILVLTEYDERLQPKGFKYETSTNALTNIKSETYLPTERRVKIFSKYPIVKQFQTFNTLTSCCVEIKTERGSLAIYGTIIGVYGNRHQNFKDDLHNQIADFKNIGSDNNICIVGDYNLSFTDNYYFTNYGRQELNTVFGKLNLKNLTALIPENIDHITISQKFAGNSKIEIETWNLNKKLSDHIGVSIELKY